MECESSYVTVQVVSISYENIVITFWNHCSSKTLLENCRFNKLDCIVLYVLFRWLHYTTGVRIRKQTNMKFYCECIWCVLQGIAVVGKRTLRYDHPWTVREPLPIGTVLTLYKRGVKTSERGRFEIEKSILYYTHCAPLPKCY